MTLPRAVTVSTPAKINLGLEILGRRDDGYHEIRTVMAAVDLADTIRIEADLAGMGTRISGVPDVRPDDNIIARAAEVFADATGIRSGLHIDVDKRIPSPGGMGGASSNAAGTLLALDAMFDTSLSREDLLAMAVRLGSDVPFFLGTPCALATGTGTDLDPLPSIHAAAVLVTPPFGVAAKTTALYRALTPDDFSGGDAVAAIARSLERGELPAQDIPNAFTRPLYEMEPPLRAIADAMQAAGAQFVALTGAGPGHYTLVRSLDAASELAGAIREHVGPRVRVATASFLTGSASPVTLVP